MKYIIVCWSGLFLMIGCQMDAENTRQFIQAQEVKVAENLSVTGVIRNGKSLEIRPQITGQILEVLVQEKDSVTQDQALFRVLPEEFLRDADSLQNLIHQAKDKLIHQKQLLEKTKNQLLIAKRTSPQTLVEAQNNYQAQSQRLEKARFEVINLEESLQILQENTVPLEILAPQSGVLQKIYVTDKERVFRTDSTGTQIVKVWAELIGAGAFDFEAMTDDLALRGIQKGDSARVELSFEKVQFAGMIRQIRALSEQKYQLIISLASTKSETEVRAGMTAIARIPVRQKTVLFLPVSSVVQSQNEAYVYLKDTENEPIRQIVKVGVRKDNSLEIREGITATDWILQNPQTTTPKQ